MRRLECTFFAVVLALLVGAAPTSARADEVDIAVDAFAIAGASVGFTLDEAEKSVTKAIVRCVVRSSPLLACTRDEMVRRLPAQARPLVGCMLQGKRIDDCASATLIQQLPPETRGVADCLAHRTDVGRCAQLAAGNASLRQELALAGKIKADGQTAIVPGAPATIRNIIAVAQGIREDDWAKVALYGGTEVYKAAAKIVLDALLTPALQPVVGPVADAIIQDRVDLFTGVIKGLRHRDERAVTEAAVEGYLVMNIEVACALPVIPTAVREATCGELGTLIKGVAKIGGDAANLAVRLVEKPLKIPDTLWKETQRGRERLSGKATGCSSPPEYYAAEYLRCYHRGTYLSLADPAGLQGLTASLNNNCRHYYDRCYFSNRFDGLCNPQREMFERHVDGLKHALQQAADLYARALPHALETAGDKVCTPSVAGAKVREFTERCARALHSQFPVKGPANSNTCSGTSTAEQSARWLACSRAIEAVHPQRLAADACTAARQSPTRSTSVAEQVPVTPIHYNRLGKTRLNH